MREICIQIDVKQLNLPIYISIKFLILRLREKSKFVLKFASVSLFNL